MNIKATTAGFFPRPDYVIEALQETEGRQKEGLGKGGKEIDALSRGREQVIDIQKNSGLDVLVEGQLGWDDLLADFAGRLKGIDMNGLLRFFDNNRYYRCPVFKDEIGYNPATIEEYKKANNISDTNNVKPVIPGPYTLLNLSENNYYNSEENLLYDLSNTINKELKNLESNGAEIIQIDEPSIVEESKKDIVVESIKKTVEGIDAKVFLYTYFGHINEYYPYLLDIVDGVGIDLISGEKNINAIREFGCDISLALGIMDARNTKLENIEELNTKVNQVLELAEPSEMYINPNCGLDFLPWKIMKKKINVLGKASDTIELSL